MISVCWVVDFPKGKEKKRGSFVLINMNWNEDNFKIKPVFWDQLRVYFGCIQEIEHAGSWDHFKLRICLVEEHPHPHIDNGSRNPCFRASCVDFLLVNDEVPIIEPLLCDCL